MRAPSVQPCPLRSCLDEAVGIFSAGRPETSTRIVLDPRVPAAVLCHPPDLIALTVLLLQSASPSPRALTLFVFEADDPHAHVLRFELLDAPGAKLPDEAVRLAARLGGELLSSSRPGDSRTGFSITVNPQKLSGTPGEDLAGRGLSVLVVEDNVINQRAAEECLRSLGASCRVAGNGAEAARLAGEERFDLILMDIHMPVMDGITATRTIRAQPEGSRPFIAALTAFAQPGDRARCLQAGMDDFLTKPCRIEILAALLAKVFTRKKTFPGRL
jgi:CheY-like chemotaxis protein